MNDPIERQAAIGAVLGVIPYDEYWKEQIEKAVNNLPPAQNLEEVCAYLELCVEEAKDKAWGEGISFALCFIKKLLPSAQPEKTQLSEEDTTSDCISRHAAIDVIMDYPHGDVWNVENMDNMVCGIKALPSAQPEIVRCRDCKHRTSYWGNCRLWEEKYHQSVFVDDNDFCSRAERRADGQR